jgi:hypothetical protein
VKCARCAHQWRLEAGAEEPEALELEEVGFGEDLEADRAESPDRPVNIGSQAQGADWQLDSDGGAGEMAENEPAEQLSQEQQGSFGAQRLDAGWDADSDAEADFRTVADSDDELADADDEPQAAAWQARREQFAETISTLGEPRSSDYGPSSIEDEEAGWQEPRDDDAVAPQSRGFGPQSEPDPDVENRFWRTSGAQEPSSADEDDGRSGWASRLMRPWRAKFGSAGRGAVSEPEDTEIAIREALKAALEQPSEAAGRINPFEEPMPERSDQRFGPGERIGVGSTDGEAPAVQRYDPGDRWAASKFAGPERPSLPFARLEAQRTEDEPEDEEEHDPPFRLTGRNANAPIFGATDARAYEKYEEESEPDDGPDEDALEADRTAALGFRAEQHGQDDEEATAAGMAAYDETREDFRDLYDEQFHADRGDRMLNDRLEEDLADLRSELEGTHLATYERKYRFSGLAIAAAWAVFLSLISGVVLALVSFRQEIMVALPGTTDLYRGLGFEVADSGVDFADVSYRWTSADGKPMIQVTGQVVNITDRPVKVPRVLVNVRDAIGTDAVQATASVPRDELAPRESANFTLEFVSPPENVAQIELEFDHAK